MCVELYRKGKWPETPPGIKKSNFHLTIRQWVRAEEANGPEVLKHTGTCKIWTPEEKLELVSEVLAGESALSVATREGLERAMLSKWVRKYKALGYNGLVNKKKCIPQKRTTKKKDNKSNSKTLTE